MQQVLDAGFDRHVAKPIDPFDLAHVVINLSTASRLQACALKHLVCLVSVIVVDWF
jgi:CheY-like chemotaxis protein